MCICLEVVLVQINILDSELVDRFVLNFKKYIFLLHDLMCKVREWRLYNLKMHSGGHPLGNSTPFGCLLPNMSCQSPGLAFSFMTNRPYVMLCLFHSTSYGKAIILHFPHPKTLRETREYFLMGLRFAVCKTCTPINRISTKSGVSELHVCPYAHGNCQNLFLNFQLHMPYTRESQYYF